MTKSKFLTFIFSLMPGAGQMYLGLMNRGASMMGAFFGIIALATVLHFEAILFILPILWFYSFFECINKWSLTVEELSYLDDKMIFNLKLSDDLNMKKFFSSQNVFAGGIVVFIGVTLLYNTLVKDLIWRLDKYLPGIRIIADKLPALVISIIIILIGLRLISGKKVGSKDVEFYEE